MTTIAKAASLDKWLGDNGGYIHPSISIAYNDQAGYHFLAQTAIHTNATLTTMPHSLALSYLNAIIDDSFPFYRKIYQERALPVEVIGFFYVMTQYLNRLTSFWEPYLDVLPHPADGFPSPLWFDLDVDVASLEGTDVWHTAIQRKELHQQSYALGVSLLEKAGVDCRPYTWDLFRWAVTVFTSRSFSSRALTPQDSKYWTAYKCHPSGDNRRRQTVLLDFSHRPAADLDFPVLFPGLDIPNHHPTARVDWTFDPGRFTISTPDPLATGEEVFNNYGPKSNAELLLGYGFCLTANPHDTVLLTLKPPPPALQEHLRSVLEGYFTRNGEWSSEHATFALKAPTSFHKTTAGDAGTATPDSVWTTLPPALLELLTYILHHEREQPFLPIVQPTEYLLLPSSPGRACLPFLARMLVESLMAKLVRLQQVHDSHDHRNDQPVLLALDDDQRRLGPRNAKQRNAAVYKDSQVVLLTAWIGALRAYTRSLLLPSSPTSSHQHAVVPGPKLLTLNALLSVLAYRSPSAVKDFSLGIAASAGTTSMRLLWEAGWEDDCFVLMLCFGFLAGAWMGGERGRVPEYVRLEGVFAVEGRHGDELSGDGGGGDGNENGNEEGEQAEQLMAVVRRAATATAAERGGSSSTLWSDVRWSGRFVAELGGKILQYDSMMMMVPDDDNMDRTSGSEEVARVLVCMDLA